MPDREKVIKDLEEYRNREFVKEGITIFDSDPRYRKMIINDALALLKEQQREPVEPIRGEDMDSSSACWWYVCPSCRIAIDYQDRFCRHCGQALKWK